LTSTHGPAIAQALLESRSSNHRCASDRWCASHEIAVAIGRGARRHDAPLTHNPGGFMSVKPIPDAYHSITPVLVVNGAARAIEFYKKAFGATEVMRFDDPSGKVAHAELKIGDSILMLSDEHPDRGFRSPESLTFSPLSLHLYVNDVDSVAKNAVGAG